MMDFISEGNNEREPESKNVEISSPSVDVTKEYAELDRRKRYSHLSTSRIVITQHFTERTVTPGGDISLQCSANGDKPPRFIWERDGIVISTNTDSRYTLGQIMTTDNYVVTHLNISRLRVEDGGLYSCIAKEGDDIASYENRLDVYGPPYIRALPPIKVQSGETVNLKCPYYGYPISKIEWEHQNKVIPAHTFTRFKRSTVMNMNGVLSLSDVTKEQSSVFTCVVSSPSGEMARRSFELQVVEAPVVDELLLGTNLQEGQVANIYCNVRSGDLPIHFEWLKDGKRIAANLKVVERNSELFSALVIKKVGLEHCGVYTCVATNHIAKVNRSTELFIKVAPKWQEEPSNSSILLGRRGLVHCSANGYPPPQVHWMKKDSILGTWQPIHGISSLPNGTLIIEDVSLSDEGLYSCNVENGVGQPLTKILWLSVSKPVHFLSPSQNVTTRLGHAISIECDALGDDPIRISWAKNGRALEYRDQRIKQSESKTAAGLTSTLSLHYTDVNDEGVYQCKATNTYGVAVKIVYLSILEPPTPPMDIRIDTIKSRSTTITWKDTFRSQIEYYPLQYVSGQFSVWDLAVTLNVSRKDSERQSFEVQNLLPATIYSVRIASGNQVDISPYTTSIQFSTKEEPPTDAPNEIRVEPGPNPGELLVFWAPPKKHHNGIITSYHITATPETAKSSIDKDVVHVNVPAPNEHEELIRQLKKNTRYGISIQAINSAGAGLWSIPVYQLTKEGRPEYPPKKVKCQVLPVSASVMRVSWEPIDVKGNELRIIGYTVTYGITDGPDVSWHSLETKYPEKLLQNLEKYTNYTVKVAGRSNSGEGPFSEPIVCATREGVPGPPHPVKMLVASPTSLIISWKAPNERNGVILHFTVSVRTDSSHTSVKTYRVNADQHIHRTHKYEIIDLVQGVQYEAWVQATNNAGIGQSSKIVVNTPSPKVVAGVISLGGHVEGVSGSSVLLVCSTVGSPPPRTVWYKSHDIIVNHPRYTRNHDDSLLINNIDQTLIGNYTCLAKNLYGSDSVEYRVSVISSPDPPIIKVRPYRDSAVVEWKQPQDTDNRANELKIAYSLTWKGSDSLWQPAEVPNQFNPKSTHKVTLVKLQCGSKYSVRITGTNEYGTSQPAYLDFSTPGHAPTPPSSSDCFWSNSTNILIRLSGWTDNGCNIKHWEVQYRERGKNVWISASNAYEHLTSEWKASQSITMDTIFGIVNLTPATWYEFRVTVKSEAGDVISLFSFATKDEHGNEIGPPNEYFDLNMLVIVCSSILLALCLICCVYIVVKRYRINNYTDYRDSITIDNKSESDNLTASNTSHSNLANSKEMQNRIYTAPIQQIRNNSKHELYEISPYAQFAVGFRTFGHVENQDVPRHGRHKYDSETSFQVCSESEDSDSISKSTMKRPPRKVCRTPHHR